MTLCSPACVCGHRSSPVPDNRYYMVRTHHAIHLEKALVYIPKRRTLIQVLTPLKLFCYLLMTICILPENWNYRSYCIYTGVANKRIGEYAWAVGKEFGVRIGWRKYLYECTPFGYVNLWKGLSKSAVSWSVTRLSPWWLLGRETASPSKVAMFSRTAPRWSHFSSFQNLAEISIHFQSDEDMNNLPLI